MIPVHLALFAVFSIHSGSFGTADDKPRPPRLTFDHRVDYIAWFEEFVSKGKQANALEYYEKLRLDAAGTGGFPEPPNEIHREYEKCSLEPWNSKDHPGVSRYLDKCKPFLDILRRAASRRHYWPRVEKETKCLVDVTLMEFHACRTALKALIVEGWMEGDDQPSRLHDNWRVALIMGHHFEDCPLLISVLTGAAIRTTTYNQIQRAAALGILTRADLARTYELLRSCDWTSPEYRPSIVVEWASALDVLQIACPDGRLDQVQWSRLMEHVNKWPPNRAHATGVIDPRETLRIIERYYQKLAEIAGSPPNLQTLQRIQRLEAGSRLELSSNPFTDLFATNVSRAFGLTLKTITKQRATMLILVILDFKAEHGSWPGTLDQLNCRDLATIREDPWSGKDFVFKVGPKGPLLYSIGPNGEDDGGRHDAKWGEGPDGGDYVFWPVPKD